MRYLPEGEIDSIYALRNAFGLGPIVTEGIVARSSDYASLKGRSSQRIKYWVNLDIDRLIARIREPDVQGSTPIDVEAFVEAGVLDHLMVVKSKYHAERDGVMSVKKNKTKLSPTLPMHAYLLAP